MNEEAKSTIDLEKQVTYLQMVHGTIERMSNIAALYKGFSATIFAGLAAVTLTDINKWILLLAFIPIVCFFLLDTYYFQLEKKYRILYEKIRKNEVPLDFNMNASCLKSELLNAKGGVWDCLISPCISWFYLPLLGIAVVIITLKFKAVI